MKHIHKYIFATILLFLLTSTVQSAPKAFDSLGNEIEALQKDCKQYLKDPQVSKKLQTACKKYNDKVNKAFKVGYPLDASVENDTASEKKLNRYLGLLRESDESRESLVDLIRSETIRARENNNIKYFSLLIDNDKINLSSENYEFMKQHYEDFQDNLRYKHAILKEKRRTKEIHSLDRWVNPSGEICTKHNGYISRWGCDASWRNADAICNELGGRLPALDDLEGVISACGGIMGDIKNNKNNSSYGECYRKKGFGNPYGYWTNENNLYPSYLNFNNPLVINGAPHYARLVYFSKGQHYIGWSSNTHGVRCAR